VSKTGAKVGANQQQGEDEPGDPPWQQELRIPPLDAPAAQNHGTKSAANRHQQAPNASRCEDSPCPAATLGIRTLEPPKRQSTEYCCQKTHPNGYKKRREHWAHSVHFHSHHPLEQQSGDDEENCK
jgi:hypothetical protein